MNFSYDIGGLPNRFFHSDIFRILKDAGIDTIAYNFCQLNNCDEVLTLTEYMDNAKKIRAELDNAGITCNQTYSPFSLKTGDERLIRFEPNYGNIVKALEFSAVLGAKRMICYAIQTGNDEEFMSINKKLYRSLIPHCEKNNIEVSICSGFPKYINSSVMKTPWNTEEEYIEFINSFNSPYITACANLEVVENTEHPADEFIKNIGTPALKAIHLQDPEKYHDVHRPAYFKKFDFLKLREILQEMGYEGEITFECPYFMNKYPAALLPAIAELFADIGNYVVGKSK